MGSFVRRLFSMLAVIILMIGTTALLAVPQLVASLAENLSNTPANTRTLLIVAAVAIDVMLAAVLVRILRPRKKDELMVRARGAKTQVSVDSVQRQINARVAQVSDVLHVHTDVEVTKGGASVEMHVRTRPDIMIPEKQKELARVLRLLVEKQMGLRLSGEPIIHIALATDEFDTADHVTAMFETPQAAPMVPIAESTYTEVTAAPARALPEPSPSAAGGAAPVEQPAAKPEEPWRAFLLEDD